MLSACDNASVYVRFDFFWGGAWRAGGGKHTRKHENNGAGNEALLLPLIDMTNTNTHAETRTDTHRDARTQTQVQLKAGET